MLKQSGGMNGKGVGISDQDRKGVGYWGKVTESSVMDGKRMANYGLDLNGWKDKLVDILMWSRWSDTS